MSEENVAAQMSPMESSAAGMDDRRDPNSSGSRLRGDAAPADATGTGAEPSPDLGLVMDIPVTLSLEIGQTRISIRELLQLGQGSVVELQRMADEPLDVLVNGTLVARGEAVVVGERFGIRLTEVISARERLRKVT